MSQDPQAQKPFEDRAAAGRALAAELADEAALSDHIVLALPRGGVPVAYEIATALEVPLDVFLVRKLGVPGCEELALGAIASGGVAVRNERVIALLDLTPDTIEAVACRESRELHRQELAFRGDRPPVEVADQVVTLVDDGLATGSTMRAAIVALQKARPFRIIVAVPVAARAALDEVRTLADRCVCLLTPEPFQAVGRWYRDFAPTDDDTVRALLARARERWPTDARPG